MTRNRKYRKDLNGHVSLNKIKGQHYLYFQYYDDEGSRKSQYLGPLSPETQIKAKQRQIEHLQHIREQINERLVELQMEIARFEQERQLARKLHPLRVKDEDS